MRSQSGIGRFASDVYKPTGIDRDTFIRRPGGRRGDGGGGRAEVRVGRRLRTLSTRIDDARKIITEKHKLAIDKNANHIERRPWQAGVGGGGPSGHGGNRVALMPIDYFQLRLR